MRYVSITFTVRHDEIPMEIALDSGGNCCILFASKSVGPMIILSECVR